MNKTTREILKALRWLATKLPALSKALEKIIGALLLRDPETPQEVIQRSLDSSTANARKIPPSDQKLIQRATNDSSPKDTSTEAQELIIRQVEQDFADSKKRLEMATKRINSQQAIVFRFMLVAASLALILIVAGAVLFFLNQSFILAGVTTLVGLLAGGGSAILRALNSELRQKADANEKQQTRQTEYLRAIQTALALRGPERNKQIAETAKWLRDVAKKES